MIMIMELIMMMDTVKSSQLLIRPSPRSGLGGALSGIHNDYDYGVDYEDELSEKVEVPEGFGLMGIVKIKR